MSTNPSTAQLVQDLLAIGEFHSRRFLLHAPLDQPSAAPGSSHDPSESYPDRAFDANVVMVLSVLLCALICSLGLNSIIRCTLRCSSLAATASSEPNNAPARLANTGVKKKALKTFPTVVYSPGLKLPGLDTECVICLSEFANGERVRILPKCNHGFHVRCIDKWLSSHSSCPTCRHCLIETCEKIVGCSGLASSSPQAPAVLQEIVVVSIAPLEPEGLVRNYRGVLADH